jgi:hypothetical protein
MGKFIWFDYLVFAGFGLILAGIPMVAIGWRAMQLHFRSLP